MVYGGINLPFPVMGSLGHCFTYIYRWHPLWLFAACDGGLPAPLAPLPQLWDDSRFKHQRSGMVKSDVYRIIYHRFFRIPLKWIKKHLSDWKPLTVNIYNMFGWIWSWPHDVTSEWWKSLMFSSHLGPNWWQGLLWSITGDLMVA